MRASPERPGRRGAGSKRCIAERFLPAVVCALLCGARPACAALWTDADTLSSAQPGAEFGCSLADIGDFDRGGFAVLAIGAHYFNVGVDTGAGAVFLFGGG